MVFGTVEDLRALRGIVGKSDFREILEKAPPGVFDARSWAYWNLVCGRRPAPPLPARFSPPPQWRPARAYPAILTNSALGASGRQVSMPTIVAVRCVPERRFF